MTKRMRSVLLNGVSVFGFISKKWAFENLEKAYFFKKKVLTKKKICDII